MAYKTQQGKTKRTTVQLVLKSAPFRKGFDDVRAGKPFDYDYVDSNAAKDGWKYERGRLLANIYPGVLKVGNKVQAEAIAAYKQAKAEHVIF